MARKNKKTKAKRGKQSAEPGKSPIPVLSHLQFLILGVLLGSERKGQEIRDQLRAFGVRKTGPAFYQLMARLEDADLIEGRYRQEVIEGQIIRERVYRIKARGERAWNQSREFQLSVINLLGRQARSAYV